MIRLGNRRRRQQKYLLDVKVRREGQARARLRVAAGVLLLAGFVGVMGLGLYRSGRWTVGKLVYGNRQFTITEIAVESTGVLAPQVVTRFAGVAVGQNIFAVDLEEAQRNLEMISLVRRAEVRRVLPGKLVIRVEERVPVAQVQAASREGDGGLFYIDRSGVVIKPLRLADGTTLRPQTAAPVPTLTGVAPAELQAGRKMESDRVYSALSLLETMAESAAGAWLQPHRVDLSRPRQLVVITQQRTVVSFDTEDFPHQLRRLAVILSWARQRQKIVQTVDLAVSRSVPVTLAN